MRQGWQRWTLEGDERLATPGTHISGEGPGGSAPEVTRFDLNRGLDWIRGEQPRLRRVRVGDDRPGSSWEHRVSVGSRRIWLGEDNGGGGSSRIWLGDDQSAPNPVGIEPGMRRRHERLDSAANALGAAEWHGCEEGGAYELGRGQSMMANREGKWWAVGASGT